MGFILESSDVFSVEVVRCLILVNLRKLSYLVFCRSCSGKKGHFPVVWKATICRKEILVTNNIDTYEGFIAEAKQAMEETFEQHIYAEIDDLSGYKQEMIGELENIFEKGASTLNVEYYNDGFGAPAFDYAEQLGFTTLSDNAENENIEWIEYPGESLVESARRSIATEISATPERCLRDWFDTKHGRDILNDDWVLA